MIIADKWTDYEVLDCSGGEKLERWGEYTLVRPDPQVIWQPPRDARWNKVNARYERSSKGGGTWHFYDLPQEWQIGYEPLGLRFGLKPFHFKHTGLFPEQAANWDWFSEIIKDARAKGRPVRVLNLFAYTGGATLAAAAAGAEVTHVDASKGMVGWAKENALLSGLGEAPIRYLVDDCMKFILREQRRGRQYDAIIMDPPSYGRGPSGELWKIEDQVYPLVMECARLLSPEPLFFLISSYTTGLQPGVLTALLAGSVGKDHPGTIVSDELGLPVTGKAYALPCGASGRFTGKAAQ